MVVRKTRRKMTVDELLKTEHYRSIITLTDIFGKTKGLRQAHYRWALIENHGNIKSPLVYRQMKYFFNIKNEIYKRMGYSNNLERQYAEKTIFRNCITSNSNLSNFLKRLTLEPYNILEKKIKDDTPYYFLTDFGREQAKRFMLKQLIDGLDVNMIDYVEKSIYNVIDDKINKSISIKSKN